jgi:hypothetical protein
MELLYVIIGKTVERGQEDAATVFGNSPDMAKLPNLKLGSSLVPQREKERFQAAVVARLEKKNQFAY